jgi:hypothetical protein
MTVKDISRSDFAIPVNFNQYAARGWAKPLWGDTAQKQPGYRPRLLRGYMLSTEANSELGECNYRA